MVAPFFDEESQTIFKLAATEARALGANCIGTEHILLGLLAAERNNAMPLLSDQGVIREMLLCEILKITQYCYENTGNRRLPYKGNGKKRKGSRNFR
jgi:ATP-dependent Clp protease ATP-binding subunit ClpA